MQQLALTPMRDELHRRSVPSVPYCWCLPETFIIDSNQVRLVGYSEIQNFNILLSFADNGWIALATIHNLPCYLEALRLRVYTISLAYLASIASQTACVLTNIMHEKQISVCRILGHFQSI